MKKLEGKIAVITGGGSGIGLATAKRFVTEGAEVYIFGRRQDVLDAAVAELGPHVRAVQGDVTSLEDLDRLYEQVRSEQGHLDILFANEEEIKSLYQKDNFEDAISAVSNNVEVAAITRSEKGAVIIVGDKKVKINAEPVEKVIDTTGAGDQFAAGFLYGYTEGEDLETCGRYGAIAAAEVISHVGPRPLVSLADLLKRKKAA